MKKLLSYIWPLTRKVKSNYNGMLELTLVNGRKILDSKNANYSYGSLQGILETGLSKIDLTNVNDILLLGLGGGSAVYSLRNKFDFNGKIIAVELDTEIIKIAHEEFFITSSKNLEIKIGDAYEFVNSCESSFDLIIVDLFIDNIVPEQFYTADFCKNLTNIMSKNSSILFNLGIYQTNKSSCMDVVNYFKDKKEYNSLYLKKVLRTNSLLIVNKNNVNNV